ncbi:MAG: alpha/beta hydrolase [Thermomicrobiales bacterium]
MMNRRELVLSSATGTAALAPGTTDANATPAQAQATPRAGTLVESGYLPIGELEMYFEVHGQGEPLLLLHGAFGSFTSIFSELLPLFSRTRTVIGLDQQGHGRTGDIDRPFTFIQMAEDTAAALAALKIESADVFGYSDGGNVALGLALAHPKRVRKLVIAGTNWNNQGVHPEVLEGMQTFQPSDFPIEFRQMWEDESPNPEDFDTVFRKTMRLGVEFPGWNPSIIAAIASPLLCIIGDSDVVIPEHAIDLFRLLGGAVPGDNVGLPASQLSILPGTTHISLITKTLELFNQITAFLDAPVS